MVAISNDHEKLRRLWPRNRASGQPDRILDVLSISIEDRTAHGGVCEVRSCVIFEGDELLIASECEGMEG